jgi:hypothetical protein
MRAAREARGVNFAPFWGNSMGCREENFRAVARRRRRTPWSVGSEPANIAWSEPRIVSMFMRLSRLLLLTTMAPGARASGMRLPKVSDGGPRRRFQFCMERFQSLRRFFCPAVPRQLRRSCGSSRQGSPQSAERPSTTSCRLEASETIISSRGLSLFKPLRRHFRATRFCRQPLAPANSKTTRHFRASLAGEHARAPAPHLVGLRFPRPYHFPARIQSFQCLAATFPGDSVCRSLSRRPPGDRNASAQKIDDRRSPPGRRRRTNIERLRNSVKKLSGFGVE